MARACEDVFFKPCLRCKPHADDRHAGGLGEEPCVAKAADGGVEVPRGVGASVPECGKFRVFDDLTGIKSHEGGAACERCPYIVEEDGRRDAGHAGHELYAEGETILFDKMTGTACCVACVVSLGFVKGVVVEALYAKFYGAKARVPEFVEDVFCDRVGAGGASRAVYAFGVCVCADEVATACSYVLRQCCECATKEGEFGRVLCVSCDVRVALLKNIV